MRASWAGRRKRGYIETHCHQIRDYTLNRQKQTDDYPYGGGCGMVLYAQPIADCIRAIQQQVAEQGRPAPHIVFMTAGGQRYTEAHARRLAQYDSLLLVCGHYEGIDERVIEAFADEEISIGDYILTGGELASLVVADSVLRLQPGVLAEQKGYEEESYWNGLLEYPQYHPPGSVGGPGRPAHPAQRQPQGGGRLAGGTEPPAYPRAPARSVGSLPRGGRLGRHAGAQKNRPATAKRSPRPRLPNSPHRRRRNPPRRTGIRLSCKNKLKTFVCTANRGGYILGKRYNLQKMSPIGLGKTAKIAKKAVQPTPLAIK